MSVLPFHSSLLEVQSNRNQIRNLAKDKTQLLNRQKQIAPTVLSKPWDCLQSCWSCTSFFKGIAFALGFLQLYSAVSDPAIPRAQVLVLSNVTSLPPCVCNMICWCSCSILTVSDTRNPTQDCCWPRGIAGAAGVQGAMVSSLLHKQAKFCLCGNYFWLLSL